MNRKLIVAQNLCATSRAANLVMTRSFGLVIATLLSCASANAITIPTVPIGDVGNPNDPATGNLYGGVSYAYNIGKYEVTVGQYTAFLNAVASTDTYALYDPWMATNPIIAGIARAGAPGSYSYSVIGSPNHPIAAVNFGNVLRFANWLHNGQPTGAQNASTTENGAYTLNGATAAAALAVVTRNVGAKWFIPTENEWYKAAYYQPAAQGGDSDSYWDYPMRTNSAPFSDQPPGSTPDNTRVGNFYQNDFSENGYDDGYAVTGSQFINETSQNYLTDVGAYTSSPSYYGTFDQGGNVQELSETKINDPFFGFACGGSWIDGSVEKRVSGSYVYGLNPYERYSNIGFRVASAVPEPGSIMLYLTGLLMWLVNRSGRRDD